MSKAARRRRKAQRDPDTLAARIAREAENAAARRADPGRWGEEPMTAEREAKLRDKGFDVVLDLRRRIVRAHKQDIWASLFSRDALTQEQHDAVRRLQRDMILRAGHARGAQNSRHDHDAPRDLCAVTDRMVEAGRRVDQVLRLVGPPSCRLLVAILGPAVEGRDVDWKAETARITGEVRPHSQSALLRMAAQTLFECYEALDKAAREARDRAREAQAYQDRARAAAARAHHGAAA